jgi:hypothetical protein
MTVPRLEQFRGCLIRQCLGDAIGCRDDTKRQFHRLLVTLKTYGPKKHGVLVLSWSVAGKISINFGTPDSLPGYVRPEARTQTQQC